MKFRAESENRNAKVNLSSSTVSLPWRLSKVGLLKTALLKFFFKKTTTISQFIRFGLNDSPKNRIREKCKVENLCNNLCYVSTQKYP